jgi:hypothetical protein
MAVIPGGIQTSTPSEVDISQTQFVGPEVQVASAFGSIGFYGADPVAQLSVTGSVTAGTALTNLLVALDTLGLVNNNSTA